MLRLSLVYRSALAPVPYAVTIFVSAFLLFQVQPIIARMVLPWFGGSASVWTICLLFFQALLLLGYLYAHASVTFLQPTLQRALHLALLAASVLVLPLSPSVAWKPTGAEDPALRILILLAISVGLPFFVLSTTSPLVQVWYSRQFSRAVPYRLFALSNLASMLALISYPALEEPLLSLRHQSAVWSVGYVVFVLSCAVLAWRAVPRDRAIAFATKTVPGDKPPAARLGIWVLLAFCPSMLLMSVTTHLTQNVAPIPLLWVLPLAIYLLSFILCFESGRWYRRTIFLPALVCVLGGVAFALADDEATLGLLTVIPLFCLALFVAAMVCHGELAQLKPDPRFLTVFYLMISVGGMLGGLFVGLVAPRIFNAHYELQIGLVLTALAALAALSYDRQSWLHRGMKRTKWASAAGVTIVLAALLVRQAYAEAHASRLMARNFYGSLRVEESGMGATWMRTLYHGRIAHGMQLQDPTMRRRPTTYTPRRAESALRCWPHAPHDPNVLESSDWEPGR